MSQLVEKCPISYVRTAVAGANNVIQMYIINNKMINEMVPKIIIQLGFNYIETQVQINKWQRIPQTYNSIKIKVSGIASRSDIMKQFTEIA